MKRFWIRLAEVKRPILGRLSAGSGKPARRFVSEALYGIMARQSVRPAEIGRALEETIPLNKTQTRLSRNLGRPEPRRVGRVGDRPGRWPG